MTSEIKINPVGFVKNGVEKPRFGNWADVISDIVLDEKYSEALDGLGDYSHVTVIYWMHEVKACHIKHRPQGNPEVPVVGVFACRCPARPSPIGITTAKLVNVEGNVLKVKGLDTINGTPVLDIKPYTPHYDSVKNAGYPEWVDKLEY